ncbi:GPR1/FUN34/yaaH family-domain-containing protein [Cadophora sp. MPI-SDFR-AT-0126]|nr:GPR1/FUN34/yaaH family-domain-containing protein [Leotiomycetes sp. MPI-SDFR-AT-0126]
MSQTIPELGDKRNGQSPAVSNDNIKPTHQEIDNLNRYATHTSVAIPMDVYEKMYLNPETRVKGQLRNTFANPTPLALMGFLVASAPLGCALMGWRGAGGGGAATIGVFYFFGGMLQIIGSVMEWIIGNTFPFVVFGSYGAFWLALGATLQPSYNAEAAYTSGLTGAEAAAGTAEFLSSFAFYLVFIGVITFLYILCAFRTNVVFLIIFFLLDIALFLLAAAYWKLAEGDTAKGAKLEQVAGAFVFAFCVFGFYLLFVQLITSLDFPFSLPVGDLSTRVPSATDKRHKAEGRV